MTDLHKPIKRVARGIMPHGFASDLVVTLYPNGVLGLRERKRRKEYELSLPVLYRQAVIRDFQERKKIKKGRTR